MSEISPRPNPALVKESLRLVIDDVRKTYKAGAGCSEAQVLAMFDSSKNPHFDEAILTALGVDLTDDAALRPVKGSDPDIPLVTVMLDESAQPPVLVQRSELDLGNIEVSVPGTSVTYAGRLTTYSAFALDEQAAIRLSS